MTQKSIKICVDEIYFRPPKMNCSTNKTDVYHIDDIWSLYVLDWEDYGAEKKEDTDMFW